MLLLKDGAAIPTVSSILKAEDFYLNEHKLVYSAILSLYIRKIPPTMPSLAEELRMRNELEKVGYNLIMDLGQAAFTTAYAESYAQKIKEKSLLRQLIQAGENIVNAAYEAKKPIDEILDYAEKQVFAVTSTQNTTELEIVHPILQRAFDKIQSAVDNKGQPTGIGSGFSYFDKVTSGGQNSD